MSDGPSKIAPKAEPLDEIILGDDEHVPPPKPPPATPSKPPPIRSKPPDRNSAPPYFPAPPPPSREKRSSGRVRAAASDVGADGERDSQARKRAKMTLRIPDDEVARPQDEITLPLVARTMTGPPPPHLSADDTLELPSDELRARSAAALSALTQTDELPVAPQAQPAAGVDVSKEAGWTPDTPQVIKPTPSVEGATSLPVTDGSPAPAPFPSSEEIPVAVDLGLANDDPGTSPRLPMDSEEIRIETDTGDRLSVIETGEVEINPDDLMAVDAVSAVPQPPPAKTAGKYPAYHSAPPPAAPAVAAPTASSLMASAHTNPPASPSQPAPPPPVIAPPPVISAPPPMAAPAIPPAPPISPPPPVELAPPTNVAARRQSQPVQPAAGQLAPPPMTDNAANRKKTRPWWEELFNDDFIRTMAKISDAQIGAEVTFIEESLGCEAGAMILDLACGTGRHAVELAARRYQVVGFDLSLAMLARASDEAQDRKQKINFVQGDMREMSFEETFDGVYSWNTSFGYFDEQQNNSVIAKVHKSLKKGGQFLLDVVNRDYIVRQAPSLAWFEGDGCICMDEMQIDFITSRMKVKRTLMMDDGRTKEIEYSIRVYSLHELGKILHDNGFRVAEVSGRTATPGVFFGCEAPRTLILAEKR
ncbi:MAG: methyltransferase domain-containing protein [Labilithrix sp.]